MIAGRVKTQYKLQTDGHRHTCLVIELPRLRAKVFFIQMNNSGNCAYVLPICYVIIIAEKCLIIVWFVMTN